VQVYYTSQSRSEEDQRGRTGSIKRPRFTRWIVITYTYTTTATRKIGRVLSLALPYPSEITLRGWGLRLAWIAWSGLYGIARIGRGAMSIVAHKRLGWRSGSWEKPTTQLKKQKREDSKMEYTCIECENLYDYRDGDLNERMCNSCIEKIENESDYKKNYNEESSPNFINQVDGLVG